MKDLSQDDPLYGSARALIPSSVYSVGESGDFNLQPASSSSVMTMTNFAADESGGDDCEECEEALDNCLEDKEELVLLLNQCKTALGTCPEDLAKAELLIIYLTQQYCNLQSLIAATLNVSGQLTYFDTISVGFDISDGTGPNPVTVTLVIFADANGFIGYHSSTGPSNLFRWTIRGPEDPARPGTYVPSLGPKEANATGLTYFNVNPATWLDKELTYNGYYSLLPQSTQTNGPFGSFMPQEEYAPLCQ